MCTKKINLNKLFKLGEPYSCKKYKTRAKNPKESEKNRGKWCSKYHLTLVPFKIKVQIASKPQQNTDKKRNVDRNSKQFWNIFFLTGTLFQAYKTNGKEHFHYCKLCCYN